MLAVRQGQAVIALVCVVLGFMLAVQFRTTQDIQATVPFQRIEDLSQRLSQTEKERNILLDEVHTLRQAKIDASASSEFALTKMGAGLVDLEGPGIVVTIDDSKRPVKPGENANLYLIHDDDILKVINELWAAGAEAVAINDQRLVVTSEIRCAGPTLSVNNTRYSPPYDIKAIGHSATLESALKMRGGVVETLQFWGIEVAVKPLDYVLIPAFKGSYRFSFAKPVNGEGVQ